jgi:hypothetical protein
VDIGRRAARCWCAARAAASPLRRRRRHALRMEMFRRDVDARRLVSRAVAATCAFLMRAWLVGAHRLMVLASPPRIDVSSSRRATRGHRLRTRCSSVRVGGQRSRSRAPRHPARPGEGRAGAGRAAVAGHALTAAGSPSARVHRADWLADANVSLWVLAYVAGAHLRCAHVRVRRWGGACSRRCVLRCLRRPDRRRRLGRHESHVFPFLGAACFLGAGYGCRWRA